MPRPFNWQNHSPLLNRGQNITALLLTSTFLTETSTDKLPGCLLRHIAPAAVVWLVWQSLQDGFGAATGILLSFLSPSQFAVQQHRNAPAESGPGSCVTRRGHLWSKWHTANQLSLFGYYTLHNEHGNGTWRRSCSYQMLADACEPLLALHERWNYYHYSVVLQILFIVFTASL